MLVGASSKAPTMQNCVWENLGKAATRCTWHEDLITQLFKVLVTTLLESEDTFQ